MVTPDTPADGGVISTATMVLNSSAAEYIGVQPVAWTGGWELTSFYEAYGIELWVGQSDDATELGEISGTMGDHDLDTYETGVVGSTSIHTWLHPSNNHPLVGPTIVGLQFDKPTWGPTAAYLTDDEGSITWILPSTNAIPFQHTGLPDDDIGPWLKPWGINAIIPLVLEQGITLRGNEEVPSELTRIWLADVTGMGMGLEDLNDDLLDSLGGIELCVPCLGTVLLGLDGVEHVLVFSDGSNLTSEMLGDPSVVYHVLDRPDILLYEELVVMLESEALVGGSILTHRSYSLLGQSITGIDDAGLAFLLGDANLDGIVSADDYASVQANLGSVGSPGGGLVGDANHDGIVSADDYASIQANFGAAGGMPPVPEPASLALLLAAGVGFTALRKRRQGS